jgi:hypothetical protein
MAEDLNIFSVRNGKYVLGRIIYNEEVSDCDSFI